MSVEPSGEADKGRNAADDAPEQGAAQHRQHAGPGTLAAATDDAGEGEERGRLNGVGGDGREEGRLMPGDLSRRSRSPQAADEDDQGNRGEHHGAGDDAQGARRWLTARPPPRGAT